MTAMEKNSALLRDRPIKVINKRTNLPAWQVLACLGSAAGHVTELTPLSLSFFLNNRRHPGDVAEDEEGSVVATVAICRGVAAGTVAGTVVAVAVSRLIRLSA